MEKNLLIIIGITIIVIIAVTLFLVNVLKKLKTFKKSLLENYEGHTAYQFITVPYLSILKSIVAYSIALIIGITVIAISVYSLL